MAEQNAPKRGQEECIGNRSKSSMILYILSTQGSDEPEDGESDDVEEPENGRRCRPGRGRGLRSGGEVLTCIWKRQSERK